MFPSFFFFFTVCLISFVGFPQSMLCVDKTDIFSIKTIRIIEKSKIIDYSNHILLLTSHTINWLLSIFIENYRLSILSTEHAGGSNRLYPCFAHPIFAKQFPYSYSEFWYFKRVNSRISKGITVMKHFSKENYVHWYAV